MIIIALSSAPFEDFDPKSKIFIEQTLDHVDQHFKGFNTIDQQIESSKSHATQTVTLNYFDTIESENKTFNKKLVGKKVPEMVQEKIYDLMPIDSITYFDKNAVNKVKKSKKKQEMEQGSGFFNKEIGDHSQSEDDQEGFSDVEMIRGDGYLDEVPKDQSHLNTSESLSSTPEIE